MKKTAILLLIIASTLPICAQKITLSLDGSYKDRIVNNWGLGVQGMISIYNNEVYLAPHVLYNFEKSYRDKANSMKTDTKVSYLFYGVDLHYLIRFSNASFCMSPYVGLEGVTSWVDNLWISSDPNNRRENSAIVTGSGFEVLGNVGVSGKYFLDKHCFLNGQVQRSFIFRDEQHGFWGFTLGLGIAF